MNWFEGCRIILLEMFFVSVSLKWYNCGVISLLYPQTDLKSGSDIPRKKSNYVSGYQLHNLSGSLLWRCWRTSSWRGATRSEDTHFIRQWREQQKPSLPFVCDAHAEALAAIKTPGSLWMGPDRYWSHRQSLLRALISAADTTASHISSFHRNP